ncbi:MAG: sigma-70 family RNA polymerase sigma factor [Planctomycetota bacterium]|nr:sigma-70 family RNA polymerase sigma factor [Planctomycetota bacterium]
MASLVTGHYDASASIGHASGSSVGFARDTSQEVAPISADQLLHRVSAGEAKAVQECIGRFGGLIWALARRSGLPEADLEDAVHEIFTELWHNGHKYDPQIASEAAFVAIIARRRLIDRRRRIGRRPTTQELTEFNSGEAANPLPANPDIAEEAAVAAKALETLSSEQQRVLRLSVYEGLSHELISRATGLPLGTVKTHARRGLLRLREMLAGDPAEGVKTESKGGVS